MGRELKSKNKRIIIVKYLQPKLIYMKKLIMFMLSGILGLSLVEAQNSAVNKADALIKEGKLAEAKEQITPALENEKTMDKGKTWYLNGLVYKGIASSDDPAIQALDDNPFQKAKDSFEKVFTLEKEGNVYYEFARINMDELWSIAINKGASSFQNDDPDAALEWFLKAKSIKPSDTTSILYSGVAAQTAEKYDVALENYQELIKQGYIKPDVYGSIISILRTVRHDTLGALKATQEAIEKFPENDQMKKQELDILISMNRKEEAMMKLKENIAANPQDPVLYFSLGYLYDETEQPDSAIVYYKKAIELDPGYYEANVNVAIIYYNRGINTFNELNNMEMADYKKRGPAMEAKGKKLFQDSLPFWEAALKTKPGEPLVLESLMQVYTQLKMNDKAKEMSDKLDSLDNKN